MRIHRPESKIMTIGSPWMRIESGKASGAVDWWLAGGISAANCIAAYQAKGAASLAASYVNLANPGTYDAAPGVAPTWVSGTGWTFNGSNQYLETGIVPDNDQSWSVFCQFDNGALNLLRSLIALDDGSGKQFILRHYQSDKTVYGNGSFVFVASPIASGNLGISGNQGYKNGISDGLPIAAGAGSIAEDLDLYIAAQRQQHGSGVDAYFSGDIVSVSIYNIVLSVSQITAVTNAMAAL